VSVTDPAARCQARPDHPTRVPRPHLYVNAETVEGALLACVEKMRGGRRGGPVLPPGVTGRSVAMDGRGVTNMGGGLA
jgi:hypothetical protein